MKDSDEHSLIEIKDRRAKCACGAGFILSYELVKTLSSRAIADILMDRYLEHKKKGTQ